MNIEYKKQKRKVIKKIKRGDKRGYFIKGIKSNIYTGRIINDTDGECIKVTSTVRNEIENITFIDGFLESDESV